MPNPVHSTLSLSLSSTLNDQGTLSLWDMEGNLLRQTSIGLTSQTIEWDLEIMPLVFTC